MIELKTYSLSELRKALKISDRAWKERRQDILNQMDKTFEYEIESKGRYVYFHITKQYAEYKLPAKKDIIKMNEYYTDETRRIVKEQPFNTGSNIARNIIADGHNIYEHQEDTIARYVRPIIKEKFVGPATVSEWRKPSEDKLTYLPMEPEELEYLMGLFEGNSKDGLKEKEMSLFSEYKNGYITEEELKDKLMSNVEIAYNTIMQTFKAKYHYRPQKVKYLQEMVDFEDDQDFVW